MMTDRNFRAVPWILFFSLVVLSPPTSPQDKLQPSPNRPLQSSSEKVINLVEITDATGLTADGLRYFAEKTLEIGKRVERRREFFSRPGHPLLEHPVMKLKPSLAGIGYARPVSRKSVRLAQPFSGSGIVRRVERTRLQSISSLSKGNKFDSKQKNREDIVKANQLLYQNRRNLQKLFAKGGTRLTIRTIRDMSEFIVKQSNLSADNPIPVQKRSKQVVRSQFFSILNESGQAANSTAGGRIR